MEKIQIGLLTAVTWILWLIVTPAKFSHSKKLKYKLQKSDHYARAACCYNNGTTIFLNPLFFTPETGYTASHPLENREETIFFRTMGAVILLLWLVLLWRFTSPGQPGFFPERRLSLR